MVETLVNEVNDVSHLSGSNHIDNQTENALNTMNTTDVLGEVESAELFPKGDLRTTFDLLENMPNETTQILSLLDQYRPELTQWIASCQLERQNCFPNENVSLNKALHFRDDDIVCFFETKHPELLAETMRPALFDWMTANHEHQIHSELDIQEYFAFQRHALYLIQENRGNLALVVSDCGLKSIHTLEYWQIFQRQQQTLASHRLPLESIHLSSASELPQLEHNMATTTGSSERRRGAFKLSQEQESELLSWIIAHNVAPDNTASDAPPPLTKHDVLTHLLKTYPEWTTNKSIGALKVWVARFLKRHLQPKAVNAGLLAVDKAILNLSDNPSEVLDIQQSSNLSTAMNLQNEKELCIPVVSLSSSSPENASVLSNPFAVDAIGRKRVGREKRGCPEGYVLHSNEFKLNALKRIDDGQSMADVAKDLGLKCVNTLVYWNSIREKLAMSEKKRFRLAGGGRRSSCSFEQELIEWVSDRASSGQGTDVKSVLDHLKACYPEFTGGKKEPTLRKWILRFFKRCWRVPSAVGNSLENEPVEGDVLGSRNENQEALCHQAVVTPSMLHISMKDIEMDQEQAGSAQIFV